jgi:hypothetical protein
MCAALRISLSDCTLQLDKRDPEFSVGAREARGREEKLYTVEGSLGLRKSKIILDEDCDNE